MNEGSKISSVSLAELLTRVHSVLPKKNSLSFNTGPPTANPNHPRGLPFDQWEVRKTGKTTTVYKINLQNLNGLASSFCNLPIFELRGRRTNITSRHSTWILLPPDQRARLCHFLNEDHVETYTLSVGDAGCPLRGPTQLLELEGQLKS
jgi:hypothetical protein